MTETLPAPETPAAPWQRYARLPTNAMTELFEATEPMLLTLRSTVDRIAARRPGDPVSAGVLTDARVVLAAARRVLSREPMLRGRLELRDAPDWASLSAKLAFATRGFADYKQRHRDYDPDDDIHLWHTREWASVHFDPPKSDNRRKGLDRE